MVEPLEDRRLLAVSPWQNPTQALDVNNDSFVSPFDALLIINRLNTVGAGELPPVDAEHAPPPYYDTDGDGFLAPRDALLVINLLNGDDGPPALAANLELDSQGRILLPPELRAWAGIEREAVIVGVNTSIEIWSQGRWQAQQAEMDEQSTDFASRFSGLI